MKPEDYKEDNRDRNEDPITGEPGSHPVATGVGTAGAGAAGAAIGAAVGGPVGAVVGAVVGGVAGGYAGKAAGEAIDPTAEDAYWRSEHPRQPHAAGAPYDEYQPAYRTGWEGVGLHGDKRTFEQAEPDLEKHYQGTGGRLPWEKARSASRAAWQRVLDRRAQQAPPASSESHLSEHQRTGSLGDAQMPR